MGEVTSPPDIGGRVSRSSFRPQKIPSTVVWLRDGMAGSSSTRMSISVSCSPGASRAMASARVHPAWRSAARRRSGSARSITRSMCTSRSAEGRFDRGTLPRQGCHRGGREPSHGNVTGIRIARPESSSTSRSSSTSSPNGSASGSKWPTSRRATSNRPLRAATRVVFRTTE